jgi:hypothetical protein
MDALGVRNGADHLSRGGIDDVDVGRAAQKEMPAGRIESEVVPAAGASELPALQYL